MARRIHKKLNTSTHGKFTNKEQQDAQGNEFNKEKSDKFAQAVNSESTGEKPKRPSHQLYSNPNIIRETQVEYFQTMIAAITTTNQYLEKIYTLLNTKEEETS